MNIAIVGTGYVGLVTGTCFAEMGVRVYCVDRDQYKVAQLQQGVVPIYEPGLEDLVARNSSAGRLSFHTSLSDCIGEVSAVFVAVGTPSDSDGGADLSAVYGVAKELGRLMVHPIIVVTKSTVPVGTTARVRDIIQDELDARGMGQLTFEMANNPEFLKEGAAIKDFMSPDRVIVGVESEVGRDFMSKLYRPFLLNNFRVLFMDIASSELTKYACNAMLATRISFMNELANLSEKLGADVEQIRQGMGADKRIGSAFLYPGCGYGGSCFPKDVQALAQTALEHDLRMRIIEEVHAVNEAQKEVPLAKVTKHLGDDLTGCVVAVWGLAFKPETDDMRDAPALVLIRGLLSRGAVVQCYDPAAMQRAQSILEAEQVTYADDMYSAVAGVDALVIVTEWKQFRLPIWTQISSTMRGRLVVDARNIFVPSEVRSHGLIYEGIGRQ